VDASGIATGERRYGERLAGHRDRAVEGDLDGNALQIQRSKRRHGVRAVRRNTTAFSRPRAVDAHTARRPQTDCVAILILEGVPGEIVDPQLEDVAVDWRSSTRALAIDDGWIECAG